MDELSFMAFAVAYRRVGVVLLRGGKLAHWQISTVASYSAQAAADFVHKLIRAHQPNVVVTEKLTQHSRKSEKTRLLIAAIAKAATEHAVLDVAIERYCAYENKYAEAEALAVRYPDLAPWIPKRSRFYDNEPRNTVLFEALALAEAVKRGPTTTLAAAL